MKNEIAEILALAGAAVHVLHAPAGTAEAGTAGGGDIDCMVAGLDPTWPLRLPPGWRLCQCLQYDVTGWTWVVEGEDAGPVAIDTLDDDRGLGKYGFPTSVLRDRGAGADGIDAAYLVAKRIRKRILDPADWRMASELALSDPASFEQAMRETFGATVAKALGASVSAAVPPDDATARRARRAQRWRRARTPVRAAALLGMSAARLWRRVTRPTGMYVVLSGPDGTGKSSLADGLLETTKPLFRRSYRAHWRPGILPRPGAVVGREERDATNPHATTARPATVSVLFLLYYWLDFALGSALSVLPRRVRTTFVLFERGWWDIAVDPLRYRLDVPEWLVVALGRLLPRPDLIVTLEAAPSVLLSRKQEISRDEIVRQSRAWRDLAGRIERVSFVDASGTYEDVLRDVHLTITRWLEARALRRLGHGWVSLPRRNDARWVLPRGPRRATVRAAALYQPVTRSGRLGWRVARLLARVGGWRALRRSAPPPRSALEALGPALAPGDGVASSRANHPNRFAVMLIGERGGDDRVAKVVTDGPAASLDREADALERYGSLLPPPLVPPSMVARTPRALVFEAVEWKLRRAPWRLPPDVARALGAFYRAAGGTEAGGPAHGDFAPWNLLETHAGWVLIDWEHFAEDEMPFYDLWHWFVQGHALLGRPLADEIIRAPSGEGEVGAALRACAEGARIPVAPAAGSLEAYLTRTAAEMNPEKADGRVGLSARTALLGRLRSDA